MTENLAPDIPGAKRSRSRSAGTMTLQVAREARGSNVSARIYNLLRDDIIAMRRKPGDPITEKELGSSLGVSRTPIREALLRLATENLVEVVPNAGTFVSPIPLESLRESCAIRKKLEELTVGTLAETATPSQIATLRACIERQKEYAGTGDSDAFYHADEEFHAAIAEAAGYPSAWSLVLQVKVQVDRFCHLTLLDPGRMERLTNEHAAIAEGIANHDSEAAIAALKRHLGGLMNDVPQNGG